MSNGHICDVKENGRNGEECSTKSCSEDQVDPRVQIELERLNAATDLINKLEIELDEARSNFRLLLSESSQCVNQLAKKLGSCVEKARPYYEARMQAKQLQARTQKAALRYERASSAHTAAKEMVYLAEEGLKKEGRCFDPAWQEMLNHATMRVNEAESERILSQHDHQLTSLAYNEAERNVQDLHQELKRAITKSSLATRRSLLQLNNLAYQHQLQLLPYFEMKAHFNQLLQQQRQKVHHLEENVLKVKLSYSDALHNLEEISDEIHQKRQHQGSTDIERSAGVGAESPDPLGAYIQKSHYKDFYSEGCREEFKSLPSTIHHSQNSIVNSVENNHEVKHQWKSYPPKVPPLPPEGIDRSGIKQVQPDNHCDMQDDCASLQLPNDAPAEHASSSDASEKDSSSLIYSMQQLNVKNNKIDRSPDGAEVPDAKHNIVDLNILRVQKDLSDSESLASNDTIDTLDDNQIECLLLDKVLPSDYQEINLPNIC